MHNKYLRYVSGFFLLGLIMAAFYFGEGYLFAASILFIIAAMFEYRNMFKVKGISLHKFLPEAAGSLCAYDFIFNGGRLLIPVIIFSVILSFALTVIKNRKPYILTAAASISAVFFIICGLYIIKLNSVMGLYAVIIYFSAVLAGDFAASKAGKIIPKYKLAPEISPAKTIAGSIANFSAVCLIFLLMMRACGLSIYQCFAAGALVSVFSQFGDLTISSIKRDLGIKHSSSLFFDYGGIFDRIDAFIFSAPVLYYYLSCILN